MIEFISQIHRVPPISCGLLTITWSTYTFRKACPQTRVMNAGWILLTFIGVKIAQWLQSCVSSACCSNMNMKYCIGSWYVFRNLKYTHCWLCGSNLKAWQGGFWERVQLSQLGLLVRLGHKGAACPSKHRLRSITVVDINGVHNVNIAFCGCHVYMQKPHIDHAHIRQLGWLLSPTSEPGFAMTNRCIKLFDSLTLRTSMTLQNFVHSLASFVDGQYPRIDQVWVIIRFTDYFSNSDIISAQYSLQELEHIIELYRQGMTLKNNHILPFVDTTKHQQIPSSDTCTSCVQQVKTNKHVLFGDVPWEFPQA